MAPRALELAAAERPLPLDVVAALEAPWAEVEQAEAEGVVTLAGGAVEFCDHARADAVYEALEPAARRRLHRDLARVLPEPRSTWHRALAAIGRDDELALELEARAAELPAEALVHAARLTADDALRARRLLAAAEAAAQAGRLTEAQDLIDRGLSTAVDPATRARLRRRALRLREPEAAPEAFVTEACAVEEADPALATELWVDAAFELGDSDVAAAREAVKRALALATRAHDPTARSNAALGRAYVAMLDGDIAESERSLARAFGDLDRLNPRDAAEQLHRAAVVHLYAERYERAQELADRAVEIARTHGVRPWAATALDTAAAIDVRLGRYARAMRRSREALRLSREIGHVVQASSCLTTQAHVDAHLGREAACRARVREVLELAPDDLLVRLWAFTAVAYLELGLERPDTVVALAPQVGALLAEIGGHAANEVMWLQLLVESAVRVGRDDEARAAVERLGVLAHDLRTPIANAFAHRCRALITRGADGDTLFERALAEHRRTPRPFELARTQLLYGERLRRTRRRAAAREQLEAAHASFERLGTVPWLRAAERELAAATTGRRTASAAATLTPHERQVAALVTQGATNKEAAAALFVTTKTIEHHLSSIYAKLGVRSRSELTRRLLSDEAGMRDGRVKRG
jgi:DNA-binding NarL/FixJ family response regulator